MSTAPAAPKILAKGLVGVIAAQTALSSVDGQNGVLTYCGINIHELAGQALYEEVVHLLFYGHLPARAELDSFQATLAGQREVPTSVRRQGHSGPPRPAPGAPQAPTGSTRPSRGVPPTVSSASGSVAKSSAASAAAISALKSSIPFR